MFRALTVTFGLLLLLPAPLAATVIRVPADQPTIQAGIDAAGSGDTVLVADGLYTGPGNRDIDFLGKAIIVRSEYGPDHCIVDCQGSETEQRRGFIFHHGEARDSILRGFTIRGGDRGDMESGGGVECVTSASPTILGNIITKNRAYFGAGINVDYGSPLIAGNWIKDNVALEHSDYLGYGGGICCGGSPEIVGNIISGNLTGVVGGGICCYGSEEIQLLNNLIVGNQIHLDVSTTMATGGAGICCSGTTLTVTNCTIAMNQIFDSNGYGHGGGVCHGAPVWKPNYPPSTLTVKNSIIFGNSADFGDQCHVGMTMSGPNILYLEYSDVEGGEAAVSNSGSLIWSTGMIDADPIFTSGPLGDWYLAQTAAGQPEESPCLDTGGDLASLICYNDGSGTICLDELTTRTDQGLDAGLVDMGYHYPIFHSIMASISCVPSTGTLPFTTTMEVSLANTHMSQTRRVAGRINIQLSNGELIENWRSGYTNICGGQSYSTTWMQSIPSLISLVGDNLFTLLAVDVTPAPWNQPPYPPAGDIFMDNCTIRGEKP